ncbi:LacI family DNA-binding transcriptional regulator [Nocardioides bruguierae]|uniref:LacI family DNA-binding transcriptional regulator n=1 Tax=Nocardioides bruguierae TaxID=2945102 RepID=A0A9X2D841_9ACTN|nr:LacI family DNA-binding transcriptional regulator [Nocardioides bruguierae]MCM0621118.1 LacI family DNA-binding transcriptional regulator [Nocardioides bruguierae]
MSTRPLPATKAPTMADVARLASVSVPTVSRVLNGNVNVSQSKRERVLDAVKELNFRPSFAARALASARPEAVAVVSGNTSQYGYAETLRGIENTCRREGLSTIISVIDSDEPAEVDRVVSQVLSQPIVGVIVLKFDPPGVAVLDRLVDKLPVVAVSGLRDTRVSQAMLDETRAAEELTGYLLDLGHATVHHVRVPPSRREDGRTTGWRRALRRAGKEVPETLDATWEPASGRAVGRRLAEDDGVTAVFCGNDEIAMGVVRGLNDAGRRVPEDVSVVGFDDHPLSELWAPSLTTVRQDFHGLGSRAVQLLGAEIEDADNVGRLSNERPAVVVRDSAAPPQA